MAHRLECNACSGPISATYHCIDWFHVVKILITLVTAFGLKANKHPSDISLQELC